MSKQVYDFLVRLMRATPELSDETAHQILNGWVLYFWLWQIPDEHQLAEVSKTLAERQVKGSYVLDAPFFLIEDGRSLLVPNIPK